jgi:GNAT superfamily N-acetyltransferase
VIDVGPMRPSERRAVARMYGDAFVDDPGWVGVGPNGRERRRRYARRICGGEVWAAVRRAHGTVLVARDGGVPTAAVVYYEPDALPLSLWITIGEVPGAALAGPRVVVRSLQADARLHAGHPDEPHLFVSLLAAHPDHQRGGRGRALLNAAIARADELGVPTYLDTARPENVPYYRSFGFRETGEAPLPRGANLWYLLRPLTSGP